MNTIRKTANGFKIRTRNFAVFGKILCVTIPTANGTTRVTANITILEYGMVKSASSVKVFPRVSIQSGIMKKADNVEIVVIVIDKSRFPPNVSVQIFEAPPPGEQPVINSPSCNAGILISNFAMP